MQGKFIMTVNILLFWEEGARLTLLGRLLTGNDKTYTKG